MSATVFRSGRPNKAGSMRSKEQRVSDRRLCAATLSVFAVFVTLLFTACATPRGVPGYDGELIPEVAAGDSVTLVPFLLENHRTIDANPPHILFISFGRHDLGTVQGYGTALRTMIDTRWIAADGCVQIIAHYVGTSDLVFDRFCWRKGERIGASLDNIFVAHSAWSH